ncbi:MAG TPA: GAF domain-containing protein [Chloroflexia bacterium]|nr:GAF domain-containing protein [Chloroflexia bacterium]
MAATDSILPTGASDSLDAIFRAMDAVRRAETLEAAVQALFDLSRILLAGRAGYAALYLLSEHAGGDAAPAPAELLSLRAAYPPGKPATTLPPRAILAEAAFATAPRTWAPAGAAGPATWVLLPLGTGAATGTLVILIDSPPVDTTLARLQIVAGLAAQAGELVLLRGQAGRGIAEMSLLDRISAVVSSSLSLDEILTESLAELARVMPFEGGSIALINKAQELEIRAMCGVIDAEARQVRVPVGAGISGWVAAHGRPYLSNDLDAEQGVRPVMRSTGTNRKIKAYMAVPLTVEGRVIGILQVNSPAKHAFTGRDLALLAEVGERCAVAIERARLFDEMRARANRLASVTEMARYISASLDPDELFRICYEQVRKVMPADAFLVALYDAEATVVRYEFVVDQGEVYPKYSKPLDTGLTSYVIRTRRPLRVGQRSELPIAPLPFGSADRLSEAMVIVPLVFEGRVLGAISAQCYTPQAYSEADLSLLLTIAHQAAVAIRNAQLYQSERAAQQARDEFLSLVSHELRTPLTTIKGSAQMIQRRMVRAFSAGQVKTPEELDARQQDLRQLSLISGQADRLAGLVNDLLEISRLQSGQFEFRPRDADLVAIVRQAVEAAQALSSSHRFLVQTPPTLPGVFDATRIEQVLTNLLSNAVKYAPGDTEVRVTVTTTEPREALVQVADEGPGLSAEDQAQLFQRFYRAESVRHNPQTGLGLGLYISRQIVELHGGRIWVESTLGAGSVFQFTLPLDRLAVAEGESV